MYFIKHLKDFKASSAAFENEVFKQALKKQSLPPRFCSDNFYQFCFSSVINSKSLKYKLKHPLAHTGRAVMILTRCCHVCIKKILLLMEK
jgi:hypothetical protein